MSSGLTKTVTVFQFKIGDVEDPDLYAAEPLHEWCNSEAGEWIMEHADEEPMWYRRMDPNYLGYVYAIQAKLSEENLTFYYLKWGNNVY